MALPKPVHGKPQHGNSNVNTINDGGAKSQSPTMREATSLRAWQQHGPKLCKPINLKTI
jgi:hypothetical protein